MTFQRTQLERGIKADEKRLDQLLMEMEAIALQADKTATELETKRQALALINMDQSIKEIRPVRFFAIESAMLP